MSIMNTIERGIQMVQGKGMGSHSTLVEAKASLKLLASKPSLIVDVGGNKGEYAAAHLRATPGVELHIFEPAEVNVAALKTRFAGLPSVRIVNSALGRATATGTLYSDFAGSGAASLTRRKLDHFGVEFAREEVVNVQPLDTYWADLLQRRRIDILKLDVEGHELDVLHGSAAALDHVTVAQFEFGGCNIDTRTFFQDFWYFFAERGFNIFRLTPVGLKRLHRYREADECFTTTNYFARRPD